MKAVVHDLDDLRSRNPSLWRFGYVAVLATVGTAVCLTVHPVLTAWGLALGQTVGAFTIPVGYVVLSVIAGLPWFLLHQMGGFRFSDIFSLKRNFSRCYLPTWFGGVLGAALYACIQMVCLRDGDSVIPVGFLPDWAMAMLVLFGGLLTCYLGAAGVLVCWRRECLRLEGNATRSDKNARTFRKEELLADPVKLIDWVTTERPIETEGEDLFEAKATARRIAHLLAQEKLQSIALLGEYGSGKSSVLNLVEEHLRQIRPGQTSPTGFVVARVEGWGLRQCSAAQFILDKAIDAMAERFDCLGLLMVPENYQAALKDSGTPLMGLFGSLLGGGTDIETNLERISERLAAGRVRLVIFLEDLDRNTEDEQLWREIFALLDRLQRTPHIALVLAVNQRFYLPGGPLSRICSHRETRPPVPPEFAVPVLLAFRKHCLSLGGTIDPGADRRAKRFARRESERENLARALWPEGDGSEPADHVVALISQPRLFKTCLSRTWRIWQAIHGEVDFDDVLVATVLYATVPSVFDLLGDIDKIRALQKHGSHEGAQGGWKHFRAKLLEAAGNSGQSRAAVMALVEFLFPNLADKDSTKEGPMPQGVCVGYPTDYWRRFLMEELTENEIRDQEVLRLIDDVQRLDGAQQETAVNRLVSRICSQPGFENRVEQFGNKLTDSQIRMLARVLFSWVLTECASVRGVNPTPRGFIELWRLYLHEPRDRARHVAWLREELQAALPRSLQFANTIYYYWHDPVAPHIKSQALDEDGWSIWVELTRKTFTGRPDLLVCALRSDRTIDAYAISHMVIAMSMTVHGGPGFQGQDWGWLGRELLIAGVLAPPVLVTQLSCLLTAVESTLGDRGTTYLVGQFRQSIAESLFGEDYPVLMMILTVPTGVVADDPQVKTHCETAQQFAQRWVTAHPGEAAKAQKRLDEIAADLRARGLLPAPPSGADPETSKDATSPT